ncbi:MAG: MFS transporter [Candidatus Eisenbacteria bacterium]|nr:MFS transporter [Candidatus Eisenbacteria bacterium]
MTRRAPHPVVYLFLVLPFGVMGGYVTVSLGYLLSKAGVPVPAIAALVAASYIPHTWKFAWAPLVDTTLSRRTWYLLSSVVSAAGILLTGLLPIRAASIPMLTMVVVISNVAVTFLGMATNSLMAYATPEDQKGRAGGWFQAGNLGGTGLGGGAGLWMAQNLPAPWIAGAVLAGACLLCAIPVFFMHEAHSPHREGGLLKSLRNVGSDLWNVTTSRAGFLALFLCFLPIGSGAASNLWAAVAGDWHASAAAVGMVNGLLSGGLSAVGCIAGGWVCDRMDRKTSYIAYGALQAACAVAMALAPRTETTYVVFVSLYAFITGLTYAGFTAVVLEAIGMGAAATKYNVYASLSNFPIYYMTLLDGKAHSLWGPGGMLNTEATVGVLGLALFVGVVAILRALRPRGAPIPVEVRLPEDEPRT